MDRAVLLWMVPVNLLLVAWVWIGRMLFGVGGWMVLVYLISIVPVLLLALLVTSVLALTQRPGPDGRRALTRPQTQAQLFVWAAMLVFGAFSFDFGDVEDSDTALLVKVLGDHEAVWAATMTIMVVAALTTVVAWIALVATLTGARRRAAVPSEA
ncbi:hypothetical protein [Nocardioides marmotae]|uniref:Uncharacterized protein n=1 Tax=Nocardioides marmotae TaxID=2663857 RepID=A0A6I3J5T4_9ACTN|nr:hypothetical protein [Nocardioides marmotae]MCR6031067.1 hypothetical protein [Gordonia jinghuaiqii]MBC9731780.1 hypothetical protein [Nocardioides marmotae]MTB82902.1 hypothetical protein [Nocardioides marmotae]MTB94704.1 hypothetical protein [Nocardioides marmotae]QKE01294.1 hypothetical protein HPC71_09610 [Nocardioides marmotae]